MIDGYSFYYLIMIFSSISMLILFKFQICRSLSFSKDSFDLGASTSTSQTHSSQQFSSQSTMPQRNISSQLDLLHLSPLNMGFSTSSSSMSGNISKMDIPLIHDSEGLGPMVGRYPFNSQTENSNTGTFLAILIYINLYVAY